MELLFNMKVFLIFGLFFIVVSANDQAAIEQLKQCVQKEGINQSEYESVMKIMSGQGGNPTKPMKCFIACLMEISKIMTGNDFNMEVMKKSITQSIKDSTQVNQVLQIVDNCAKSMKSTDRCERAYEFIQCVG